VCLDDSWPLWALLLLIVFVVLAVLAIIILIYLCLMHYRQRQICRHSATVVLHFLIRLPADPLTNCPPQIPAQWQWLGLNDDGVLRTEKVLADVQCHSGVVPALTIEHQRQTEHNDK